MVTQYELPIGACVEGGNEGGPSNTGHDSFSYLRYCKCYFEDISNVF